MHRQNKFFQKSVMKLVSVILAVIATATGGPLSGRIFGGDDAASGQFPFIVALNDPDQFCDGSIIDKKWILTAAHCLARVSETTTVFVGSHIEHVGGASYNITSKIIHEEYDNDTIKNDIGLLQIDGELEFNDFIKPIEFIDPQANSICTAIGWGITDIVDFPEVVQYVNLVAIDMDYCQEIVYPYDSYLGPEQVCTLAPQGKGTCFGDSGGPLVCDGKLAGIVSYLFNECGDGLPDVYTKPSAYADWVQTKIQSGK